MLAEFANYKSWIDWVPIVSILAVPLVFRRVPVVIGAMVGAFVGYVVILITMPLGSYAEQLGANTAFGLIGGAVTGALVGSVIGVLRKRSEPLDASVTVVGWAIGLGLLGTLVGGFGPSIISGAPPDLEVPVLGTIAVGGVIGWVIGAAIGWRLARTAPPAARTQRWILLVAAIGSALLGGQIIASIQSHAFGPPIDEMTRAQRDALPMIAALYCVGTTLVVSTLIAAAARGIATARMEPAAGGLGTTLPG
jgi:hypothetical protein